MRTTLACQWCRKSKIKCHHNGAPPCQLCRANPGRECVLSTPVLRRKERNAPYPPPTSKTRTYHISETSAPDRTDKVHADQQDRRPQKDGSTSDAVDGVTTSGEMQSQVAPQQVAAPLSPEYALVNVNSELVTHASRIFVKQFPEFGFVHKPTFFEHGLQDEIPSIKLCAILALCSRYLPELSNIFGHFANVVRENIMSYMAQYPGIDAAHALILLSLYEWGEGNGFQAWIYTDLEIRNVQFQTPFSAFCIFSAAAALVYADTWPYMAPGLENAKEKYQWSFDWLQSASEKWKVAKRWHEMLSELAGIFTRLKTEGQNFPHLGREEFQDLHDSMHRLAEPESTTVNALATLSQGDRIVGSHTQPYLGTLNGGEDPVSHVPHARDAVRLHAEHSSTSERHETELTAFEDQPGHTDNDIGVDPGFLLAMLSDPSGDWSHVV
ncbi:uncharacterized protein BDW43DRAFT_303108 [Aspergillus alliaceus]|uniref:uncharacterized protein n=1 Tax=Petromyces alliaceus TaxID=209559 RepID=UPI0012A3E4C6|nr:uncharacterized protein BDW43DRAFT_303108 [Aspergillus alliaceus]KAB8229537.1 hypothetical protein BDW43DRAFT_303108 [Aspergillus alliaceus]